MNDELKAVKKQPVYNCQRCKNHGRVAPRRAHQRQCPFKHCLCRLCQLIDHRRIVMRSRNQIHQSEGMLPYPRMTECRSAEDLNVAKSAKEKKSRKPRCFLCSGHGKDEVLKDHKRRGCPYEYCICDRCELGRQYRRLMAVQTKQRRDQTRDDCVQIVEIKERDTPSMTPPMNNCASTKEPPKTKSFLIKDILGQNSSKEETASTEYLPKILAVPQSLRLPLSTFPELSSLSLNFRRFQQTMEFLNVL